MRTALLLGLVLFGRSVFGQVATGDEIEAASNPRTRGQAPRSAARQVSAWLHRYLDDPRGMALLECRAPKPDREGWDVECDFRARTRAGGFALQTWVFIFVRGRCIYGDRYVPEGPTIRYAIEALSDEE